MWPSHPPKEKNSKNQKMFLIGASLGSDWHFMFPFSWLCPQLLTLPSLLELQALLQGSSGLDGGLGTLSEALCSAKGPSNPRGLSLNWYENQDFKELVNSEPELTPPNKNLSECPTTRASPSKSMQVSWRAWRSHGMPTHFCLPTPQVLPVRS